MIAKNRLFRLLLVAVLVGISFVGHSFAQQTVTVSLKYSIGHATVPEPENAPVAETYLEAAPSNPSSVTSVVFYRNDVPIATVTASPFKVDQGVLGQDTYVFRARAHYSNGEVADSADRKLTAYSPNIYTMGTTFLGVATEGPKRWGNHTTQIQQAVNAISDADGGTLFFPCTFGRRFSDPQNTTLDGYSIYVINDTVTIPENVTLQGEAAGDKGRCQIWWYTPSHNPSTCGAQASGMDKPMFRIAGGTSRVRLRDLALRAMGGGEACYYGRGAGLVAGDGNTGIEITTVGATPSDPQTDGDVSDVILENVAIAQFTRGISALSPRGSHEIHNIKIRAALPIWNHRQLYINAPYAYDWDVQNFNAAAMGEGQGALEIEEAGVPPGYQGGRGDLRFVQLNCAGGPRRALPGQPATVPSTCITVKKHGGLYFKQVHVEGPSTTITVPDIYPETNDAPIIFEASGLSGEFHDASMKLYSIGSYLHAAPEVPQPSFWDSKMHFWGNGLRSQVVDCGNVHGDRTDTDGDPNDLPEWIDWTMQYTHAERQRASYFDMTNGYAFRKEPISCPSGRDDGVPDTNNIGGRYFDNGVLPTEPAIPYSNPVECDQLGGCDLAPVLSGIFNSTSNAGAVRIIGEFDAYDEILIPEGRLIVGSPGATVTLKTANKSLFKRTVGVTAVAPTVFEPIPASFIVIRDLTLKTTQPGTTAIRFAGTGPCDWIPNPATPDPNDEMPDMSDPDCHIGMANDFSLSGLTIEGFSTGFYGGRYDTLSPEPMIDSIALRKLEFVNNQTAVRVEASNASNWNIHSLQMRSNSANAQGWLQKFGGNQSFQSVKCSGGPSANMEDCLRLDTTGAAVLGMRPGTGVTNMVTIESPHSFYGRMTGHLLIRDSDMRSATVNESRFNIRGKIFLTSINNRYRYFGAGSANDWDRSRVTHCADEFVGGTAFPGLSEKDDNLYFGVDMPTRLSCETKNPKPWSEAFKWGGEYSAANPQLSDVPLAGNFYDDVRDDYVIYRRTSQSQFMIRKGGDPVANEPPTKILNWGLPGDVPVIGRFLASTPRSQVAAFRDGVWWVKDPNDTDPNNYWAYYWGVAGDKPFTGNFFKEAGGSAAQRDEIAIYRPGAEEIWILNPRSGVYKTIYLGSYRGNQVQTGDFLGVGNDQIAMYQSGNWYIVDADPLSPAVSTATLGSAGDVPVAGQYLPQLAGYPPCAQLGVWRPSAEEFIISDPSPACGGRGITPAPRIAMGWGSNNDYGSAVIPDDIPLTVNVQTQQGVLSRPTAYRPTAGHFQYSNQNGLWFVHDPF